MHPMQLIIIKFPKIKYYKPEFLILKSRNKILLFRLESNKINKCKI